MLFTPRPYRRRQAGLCSVAHAEMDDARRTPDGRYLVVRGRLWRTADPRLPPDRRDVLVKALMAARREVGAARRAGDVERLAAARAAVDAAKVALGERGPPWWDDGAPDYNRHLARNTPYAAWYAALPAAGPGAVRAAGTRPGVVRGRGGHAAGDAGRRGTIPAKSSG